MWSRIRPDRPSKLPHAYLRAVTRGFLTMDAESAPIQKAVLLVRALWRLHAPLRLSQLHAQVYVYIPKQQYSINTSQFPTASTKVGRNAPYLHPFLPQYGIAQPIRSSVCRGRVAGSGACDVL